MAEEAARVKKELEEQARTLFERKPLGWSWGTIKSLYIWRSCLPLGVAAFVKHIVEQGRVLAVVTDIYLRVTKVKTRGALYSVCRRFN